MPACRASSSAAVAWGTSISARNGSPSADCTAMRPRASADASVGVSAAETKAAAARAESFQRCMVLWCSCAARRQSLIAKGSRGPIRRFGNHLSSNVPGLANQTIGAATVRAGRSGQALIMTKAGHCLTALGLVCALAAGGTWGVVVSKVLQACGCADPHRGMDGVGEGRRAVAQNKQILVQRWCCAGLLHRACYEKRCDQQKKGLSAPFGGVCSAWLTWPARCAACGAAARQHPTAVGRRSRRPTGTRGPCSACARGPRPLPGRRWWRQGSVP